MGAGAENEGRGAAAAGDAADDGGPGQAEAQGFPGGSHGSSAPEQKFIVEERTGELLDGNSFTANSVGKANILVSCVLPA